MEQQRNILLVVSNQATRKLLKTILLVDGYIIHESENGKDGLQLAKEIHPDLIIQDLNLPDYEGEALAQAFHDLSDLKPIPIFCLVGFLTPVDFGKLRQTFQVVLIKPIYSKLLLQYVHLYLNSEDPAAHHPADYTDPVRLKSQLSLFYTLTYLLATNRRNIDHALEEVLGLTLDSAGINKGLLFLKNEDKWSLHQFVGYSTKDKPMLENFFDGLSILSEVAKQNDIIKVDESNVGKNKIELMKKLNIKTGLIVPITVNNECICLLFLVDDQVSSHLGSYDSQLFASFLGKHIGQVIHTANLDSRLRLTEQRWNTLIESVNCAIFIIDNQGVIFDINQKAEELFGYSRPEILGKTYLNFIPDEANATNTIINKLLLEKNIGPTVAKIKRPNGSVVDVEYSIVTAYINDKQMYVAIINDISEIESLRRQAILNDKLATIGTLAAGIVHEINNPVAWVLTNLHFLKEHIKKYEMDIKDYHFTKTDPFKHLTDLKRELVTYNELVTESIEGITHVKDIVRDLKGFTRVEEHQETYCDIHDILNSALKIAASQSKNKIAIEKYFADNIPKAMFERGKIQQVFLNLIVNAMQSIADRTDHDNIMQIHTHVNNNKVYVDIADNGPGINPEILPKIFDPFFTTKPTGVGTGLGLSICKEIIEHLGGEIGVKTELDKGTTFTIILPLKLEKPKKEPPIQPDNMIAPARILVVDDEPTLLKTIQRILEGQHQVTIAHGGQLALDLLQKNNYDYDIIITDLSMPKVNGIDIYRHVEKNSPGLEKHVIFITGGMDSMSTKKFLATLSNVCVPKPFAKEELLHAIAVAALTPT